jgi:hypothetical protein
MKRLLQGGAGLVALAMAVPALAADLPARTYTKGACDGRRRGL